MNNRDEWDQLVEQNEDCTLTLTLAQRNAIADANAYICDLEVANRLLRDESATLRLALETWEPRPTLFIGVRREAWAKFFTLTITRPPNEYTLHASSLQDALGFTKAIRQSIAAVEVATGLTSDDALIEAELAAAGIRVEGAA
jgi:hypothetical protein